jgi:hypothetical protein
MCNKGTSGLTSWVRAAFDALPHTRKRVMLLKPRNVAVEAVVSYERGVLRYMEENARFL